MRRGQRDGDGPEPNQADGQLSIAEQTYQDGRRGRRGGRVRPPIPDDELQRLRLSGEQKVREGRSREITAAEAGAMGGSQVKEAFRLLRERASAHGRTVTEEITSLTGPGDEALNEEEEAEAEVAGR